MFLNAVENLKGCPRVVRSDCETENVLIAGMQSYFRAHGNDEYAGVKAHQYGSSPSNLRIESWWSFFRRSNSTWWINIFKDMSDSGLLELGNTFHMHCLWFCYSKVIQNELYKVKEQWNSHYIRKSRHDTIPGVPDILYYLPENSGAIDCLVRVPQDKIDEVEPQCYVDEEEDPYTDYFEHIIQAEMWDYPGNAEEAFNLFQNFNNLQEQVQFECNTCIKEQCILFLLSTPGCSG